MPGVVIKLTTTEYVESTTLMNEQAQVIDELFEADPDVKVIFGFGYAYHLAQNHLLYLANSLSYVAITSALHLIYGFTLGYLNSRWLAFRQTAPSVKQIFLSHFFDKLWLNETNYNN